MSDEVIEETFNALDFEEYFGLIGNEDLVIIRPYLDDEDDRVLEELRPKYVVMYDPNPSFVRRIEVRQLRQSLLGSQTHRRRAGLSSGTPRSRHSRLLPRI
jgi:DNA excision repair protein ERCC-4